MLKLISKILIIIILLGFSSTKAEGASNLSLRVEKPKSPTNQDNFTINFVTLDIQERPITVKCFKKGPSEGSFSQFGAEITVSAGGGTDNCQVNSSILNTNGTYQFQISASAESDTVTSSTISVDFNTSTPDTPINYSKEKIFSCVYRLKFKTADDNGKTVKVELYRSENTSFNVDLGTRVDSTAIGSNTDGQFENTVSDCNKTYYFALRAFNNSGNGSGVIADNEVTVITSTLNPTISYSGAIPVITSTISVNSNEFLATEGKKEVLNEASVSGKSKTTSEEVLGQKISNKEVPSAFSIKNLGIGLTIILLSIIFYFSYKRIKR